MTTYANSSNIRAIMSHKKRGETLNILTATTHERYESNLCKTGHNFYALNIPGQKTWDTDYAPIPHNYQVIDNIPDYLDFDIVLSHTSCKRLQILHNVVARIKTNTLDGVAIPIIRHTHVLPDVRMNVEEQISAFHDIRVDVDSFISKNNAKTWTRSKKSAEIIEHGIDTEFWNPQDIRGERLNACLSVVNDWPNRDWCCGFNLWRETTQGLPVQVFGKSPGFSLPAQSTDHLRHIYSTHSIFYNTSLHSPVPTVLMEAMACGCAIVSTANCMIPEIIEHNYNGLLSNDPKELRTYLEELLANPEKARELGDNARKTIVEKFNLDRFVKTWNNVLFTAIENKKNGAN
jgi:hypothetical protein